MTMRQRRRAHNHSITKLRKLRFKWSFTALCNELVEIQLDILRTAHTVSPAIADMVRSIDIEETSP